MLSIFTDKKVRRYCNELINADQELKEKTIQSLRVFNDLMIDLDDFLPSDVRTIAKDSFIVNLITEVIYDKHYENIDILSMLEKESKRLKEELEEYEYFPS